MPVNDNALLEAVSTVARNRSVTVNLQKSAKAGMIAGGSCFVGAVLGGPVGLAVGGLVGTYIAYSRSGDIKPLYQIINEELDSTQKAQLVFNLQQAFSDINAQDVMMLAAIILSNSNIQEKAMKVAIEYVTTQCIGGVVGTAVAYLSSGELKPLYQIINDLDPKQKAELVIKLQEAFSDFNIQDVMMLAAAIAAASPNIQDKAIEVAKEFVTKQLKM